MVDFTYPCINNLGDGEDDWIVGLRYPGSNFPITRCLGVDHDWQLSSAEASSTDYKSNGLWTSALLTPIFKRTATHPDLGRYQYAWTVDNPTFLSGNGTGWSTWGTYGIENRNWAYEGQTKSFAIYKGELKTQIGKEKHTSIRKYEITNPLEEGKCGGVYYKLLSYQGVPIAPGRVETTLKYITPGEYYDIKVVPAINGGSYEKMLEQVEAGCANDRTPGNLGTTRYCYYGTVERSPIHDQIIGQPRKDFFGNPTSDGAINDGFLIGANFEYMRYGDPFVNLPHSGFSSANNFYAPRETIGAYAKYEAIANYIGYTVKYFFAPDGPNAYRGGGVRYVTDFVSYGVKEQKTLEDINFKCPRTPQRPSNSPPPPPDDPQDLPPPQPDADNPGVYHCGPSSYIVKVKDIGFGNVPVYRSIGQYLSENTATSYQNMLVDLERQCQGAGTISDGGDGIQSRGVDIVVFQIPRGGNMNNQTGAGDKVVAAGRGQETLRGYSPIYLCANGDSFNNTVQYGEWLDVTFSPVNLPPCPPPAFDDDLPPDPFAPDPPPDNPPPSPPPPPSPDEDPHTRIDGSGEDRIEITGKTFISDTITADRTYLETASYILDDYTGYKITEKNIKSVCELLQLQGNEGNRITVETKENQAFTDDFNCSFEASSQYYFYSNNPKQKINTSSTFFIESTTTLDINSEITSIVVSSSFEIAKRLITGKRNGEITYTDNPFYVSLIGMPVVVAQNKTDESWLVKGTVSGLNGTENRNNYLVSSISINVQSVEKVDFTAFGTAKGRAWCDNGSILNAVMFTMADSGYVDNTSTAYLARPLENINQLNLLRDRLEISRNVLASETGNCAETWQLVLDGDSLNLNRIEVIKDNIFPYDSGEILSTSYFIGGGSEAT